MNDLFRSTIDSHMETFLNMEDQDDIDFGIFNRSIESRKSVAVRFATGKDKRIRNVVVDPHIYGNGYKLGDSVYRDGDHYVKCFVRCEHSEDGVTVHLDKPKSIVIPVHKIKCVRNLNIPFGMTPDGFKPRQGVINNAKHSI